MFDNFDVFAIIITIITYYHALHANEVMGADYDDVLVKINKLIAFKHCK